MLTFIESADVIFFAVTKDISVTDWTSSSGKLQVCKGGKQRIWALTFKNA